MTSPPAPGLQHPAVVVDASVWVSALMAGESNHPASLGWLRRYAQSGGAVLAPQLLLAEVASGIARATRQPALAQQIVGYLNHGSGVELVSLDSTLALEAADLAARLYIKGADSVYVALAQQRNVPLISWDNEQLNRAKVVTSSFTPLLFPF